MNRTVLVSLLVAVVASSAFVTLFVAGIITLPFGSHPKTTTIFQSNNATATDHLLINSTKPAIQSVTVQSCNLSTVTMSNTRFPSNWFEVTVNASESCSVIVNLDYPTSYNVTFSGLSNGMAWASGGSVRLTIFTSFKVPNVHLVNDLTSFTSSTNVSLNLRNNGTANATLTSYNVADIYGNTWTLTAWSGPVIRPNAVAPTSFLIGSSCPSCTYTGTPNAFNSFAISYSYYITVVISTNQSFKYSIVR